jgi:inorganic pyrophosphatase
MNNEKSELLLNALAQRFKAHPWHGVEAGEKSPKVVRSYIETVPADQMKYEICKKSGYLYIDRPNKFSNNFPALYGFVPQTYCAELVAQNCMEKTGRTGIEGDGDPLDICVLTDRPVTHGDLLLDAIVIGGFRMIDGGEADEKIVAVLKGDQTYGDFNDISQLPEKVVKRLKHYFLTYKQDPDKIDAPKEVEIPQTYGREEAQRVIEISQKDYQQHFGNANQKLAQLLAEVLA